MQQLEPALASGIFRPFLLKSLVLRNRIVMVPMMRSFSPDRVPTAAVGDHVILGAAALLVFIVARWNLRLAAQQPQSRSLP